MSELYPSTNALEPIKFYPLTELPEFYYNKRCSGCGETPTRVDSLYKFILCEKCDPDEIAQGIADHVMNPNG